MRLSKRGRIWHGGVFDSTLDRVVWRTTRQHDKAAAEKIVGQWERDAADPDHARKVGASLSDATKGMLEAVTASATAGKKSEATPGFYTQKAGHLIRLLEGCDESYQPLPLRLIDAPMVDGYIAARRKEWSVLPRPQTVEVKRGGREVVTPATPGRHVTDSTIHKELVALRMALKWAKRAKLWSGDIQALVPSFSPEYKPRKRFLGPAAVNQLLGKLGKDDAARVAFIVATSAEWGATERAERDDVKENDVFLRGTKRTTRERTVPVVMPVQQALLAFALENAQGEKPLLFRESYDHFKQVLSRWSARLGFGRISANDLRRSCSSWLRAEGVPDELNALVLGHADTRMVQRVYGQMPLDTLRARLTNVLDCDAGVARSANKKASGGVAVATPEAQPADFGEKMAPWPGFEPGTRGLTVRDFILAKPRDNSERYRAKKPGAMPVSKAKR